MSKAKRTDKERIDFIQKCLNEGTTFYLAKSDNLRKFLDKAMDAKEAK